MYKLRQHTPSELIQHSLRVYSGFKHARSMGTSYSESVKLADVH